MLRNLILIILLFCRTLLSCLEAEISVKINFTYYSAIISYQCPNSSEKYNSHPFRSCSKIFWRQKRTMEVQVHHLKSGSSWKSCHNGKCSLFREPRKVKESSAVICKAFMGQSYPCCDSQAFWPARGIHPERKSLHIISLDLLSTV